MIEAMTSSTTDKVTFSYKNSYFIELTECKLRVYPFKQDNEKSHVSNTCTTFKLTFDVIRVSLQDLHFPITDHIGLHFRLLNSN